ncbi:pyridoxal-phosphate dependent enzyme [Spirillospora sp. NPDC048911]|uniref:threonine ammonia-lyase n=1 Tax=Spirillospora sp. NPDC048911 TaxID=3364527 RepID=UPI00371AB32B
MWPPEIEDDRRMCFFWKKKYPVACTPGGSVFSRYIEHTTPLITGSTEFIDHSMPDLDDLVCVGWPGMIGPRWRTSTPAWPRPRLGGWRRMMIQEVAMRVVRVPDVADLERAWRDVSGVLEPTPVVSSELGLLKLETFQPTGSFKVRGAIAALTPGEPTLTPGEPAVTASAGNHGLAMAYAASRLGAELTVVVSTRASAAKVAKLRSYPVRLVEHGDDYDQAEAHALSLPGRFVSPYNDPHVIAGQGTIGCELDTQVDGPLTVVAPIGGGGLGAGLTLWARQRGDVRVVGVEAAVSRAVASAVDAGKIVEVEVGETIADGLAGNLEPGCVTPEVLRHAELTSVTEAEIRAAMRWLFAEHGLVVEGAGACAVAAVLAGKVDISGRLVMVLSGRNITMPVYRDALA